MTDQTTSDDASVASSPATYCGFVALIGAPNAGKSTLLNALVGAKVAIVTHKVQTTRSRITGIAMEGDTQLVFIDTPGIFQPRRRLDRAMVSAAWRGAEDAETVVLIVDARKGLTDDVSRIIDGLRAGGGKAILALNKIDTVKRDMLLALSQELFETGVFSDVFMISALTGDGVADLKAHLAEMAPAGPFMYPEDQVADITMRMLAAEVTREKVYLRLHDELPYAITVETEKWEERKDGSVRIEQVIHVQRDSQKGMVIGKGGAMLKTLGSMAREELEAMLECRVHLFLHVRVTERWAEDRGRYSDMGLDYVD
ncbi:GTPase Era [Eilatimonas milleporae]|uniref:GTPase Era n=1 Tax=Eilatimonas milleporae TaxID=911205 RepID=A0A3M0CCE9_9PROT|nr:GTPase Era [Eilatimonas milleporae]RMB04426.1 GTP-binding protein Era [Eilatimonas milleporae]